MKKNDYDQFLRSLDLNIEIDRNLRSITEKIKFISHFRDYPLLSTISNLLADLDFNIDSTISNSFGDENECETNSSSSVAELS